MNAGVALTALALLVPAVSAQNICYDGLGRPYRCYDSGISYGARIGIGIGVAVFIIFLFAMCGYWRRKQLQKQFARYRPPALPYAQNGTGGGAGVGGGYTYGQGNNPYANNPPPPTGFAGQQSSFASNQFGNNPPPPASTYQPSMAGQYGQGTQGQHAKTPAADASEHEHGYEWEQAREAERLERERQHGGGEVPPGYDVSTAATTPVVTGNQGSNDAYAPPPGAPPSKRN